MQASSRIVFGRAFRVTPAWLWLMQRASGLLLGPLVAVHMWVPKMSENRVLNAVLLLLVLGHGYSGIRRFVQSERYSALVTAQAWAWLVLVALFGLLIVCCGAAVAQNFPVKPVRIVVGLAPGGGTDIVARMVGQRLSAATGQQIVVDNRAGASGNIAAEIVAKSPADGYTLIVVTASHAINPSLFPKMNYDPIADFSAITQLTAQPYLFVVNPRVPAKSVKEFIALANSRKDGLTYASSGAGLLGHLGMELLKTQAKFEAVHVPYKGAGPALIDTIAGQVDAFMPTIISGLPQVKSGKVRAIGVTTLKRAAVLPEVATVAEQGFPGYEVSGWYGLLAPAGTPTDVIAYFNREVVKVLHSPEGRERLAAEGAEGVGNTPEQFGAYMRSEMVKWGAIVKRSGARAD